MTTKGKKRMWTIVTILLVLALICWAALQYAISRNGPAVLDSIDRMTGGERDVELVNTVSLGDHSQQKLAVYASQSGIDSKPVIIFTHGGSWRSGSPDDYGFIARALAPEGFVVVLTGYRLDESGKFPAMVEDTAAAIAWTHANIASFGGDPEAIILAGHSAGAYNAAMVALDRQWLGREGMSDDVVKGVIGLAGPYDFYPFDSDSTRAAFGDTTNPEKTQPINFVRGDAPPMLLMTGEKDTTVKPRNTRALAKVLLEKGAPAETVFFDQMDHTAILLAIASPWRRDRNVIDRIVGFARDVTKSPSSVSVQGETG